MVTIFVFYVIPKKKKTPSRCMQITGEIESEVFCSKNDLFKLLNVLSEYNLSI